MKNKLKELAMVDVAEEILKERNKPIEIHELFKQIATIKDIELDDIDMLTQLYMDITQSGKFVYCGDDQWDLKDGNLHLWDDDGSSFLEYDDIEDEEILDYEDYILEEVEEDEELDEDLDEDTKKEIEEEKEYIDVELPLHTTDDDDDLDFDADDYDEDDYHKIMDDYEDMYDE